MQNSFLNKINVSVRLLCLILIIICIFLVKSAYLFIFFTLLFTILFILTDKSVKFYVESLKSLKILLLIIYIAYIIIFRNIPTFFVFVCKTVLSILFIKQFDLLMTFEKLNNGIKTLLKPIKILDIDSISYNVTLYIYFIKIYINSSNENFYCCKFNVFSRFFFTISKLNKLESSLKLKFYKPKFEEKNILSNITLTIFLLLFILVIFKEVIL